MRATCKMPKPLPYQNALSGMFKIASKCVAITRINHRTHNWNNENNNKIETRKTKN